MAILDEDPARRIQGRENFRAWMQEHAERAISELDGVHFDIPQPAHRIEAVIAPTSDAGIYCTRPPSKADAIARAAGAFSLKDFHAKALSPGAMGLDPLREALARI